jgi:regulator of cell morphogenesis and NO signaling
MKEGEMTTIDEKMTLGELVNAHPQLARELERWGLDYCCRGGRTLAEACDAAGLAPRALVAELTALTRRPAVVEDWTTMTAAELVGHIVATHHHYLWAELPRLTDLVEKVARVHGARHPELREVEAVFDDLRTDLEPHMLKEERVLFPMIRELSVATAPPTFHCGTLRNPISVMLAEHDRAGALLARLRDLTQGYAPPVDACASYEACYRGLAELEADTHLHIHKENNLLFPMVVELEDRVAAAR